MSALFDEYSSSSSSSDDENNKKPEDNYEMDFIPKSKFIQQQYSKLKDYHFISLFSKVWAT